VNLCLLRISDPLIIDANPKSDGEQDGEGREGASLVYWLQDLQI